VQPTEILNPYNQIMKCMEDMRDELIVILAGYPSNMDELLTRNPGLKSRFPINVPFPDYSSDELVEIAKGMLGEKQLALSEDAAAVLSRMCKAQAASGDAMSGNARCVNFRSTVSLGYERKREVRKLQIHGVIRFQHEGSGSDLIRNAMCVTFRSTTYF
jgi:hypothetical protein